MSEEDPAQALLGRSWSEIEADGEALVAQIAACAVRWQWADGRACWERVEPLWAECRGIPVVTKASRAPSGRLGYLVRYGYDAAGELVIARRVSGGDIDSPRRTDDHVWLAIGDGRVLAEFHHEGPWHRRLVLRGLTRPYYDGQELTSVVRWTAPAAGRGRARERYERLDDRVIRIHEDLGTPDGWAPRTRYDVAYGDNGEVATVTAVRVDTADGPAEPIVVYRRSSPSAVRAAMQRVRAEVPRRVEQWAQRVAPHEPVYALALLYSHETPALPPALALALESERRRWLEGSPEHAHELIWNPAEWSIVDATPAELLSDGLGDDMQLITQEWELTSDDRQPRELCLELVKALRGRSWEHTLRLAPAVAIYTTDDELTDLERNLRATVPDATRQAIQAGPSTA